jgi:branched-chain amino acid transport system substrate-binding protein
VGALKVGILVPLTGDLAPYGGPAQKGAELGVAELNKAAQASGVSLDVTSVAADTESLARPAQEAATKVVESDGVKCIAGPMGSDEIISVAQNVTVDAGVPIISPSSTASSVRAQVTDTGTVFRVIPSDSLQGPVLAQQIHNETQGGKVNVAGQNDAYGTGLIKDFTAAYEKLGGTVGASVTFNPKAASYNAEARQMTGGDPAAVAIFTYPEQWAKLGPALARSGNFDPKTTWGTDGLRSEDLPKKSGRETTEGLRGTAPTDKGNTLAPAFQKLWDGANLGVRQTFDVQMFDAAVLCGLAAVGAGSSAPADIAAKVREVSGPPGTVYTFQQLADALTALKAGEDIDYTGASGPIDLAENGDPGVGDYVVWQYKDGKLVDGTEILKAGG